MMDDLLEVDEQILNGCFSDEALEQAASREQQAVTWVYCTNAFQYCDWPQ